MVGVSTLSLSTNLRLGVRRMQSDLAGAQKEVTTGRVADIGLALGAGARQSVTFNRDLSRLDNLVSTNALADTRLKATQSALTQLNKSGQDLLQSLSANRGANVDPAILQTSAANALASMTTLLNTSLDGEYIFGGLNTDSPPFTDFAASGSPAKLAFDDAFASYFGFSQNDAAAADITADGMTGFLDTLEATMSGPQWAASWSKSTDGGLQTRIGLNEVAETSVGINDEGFRSLALSASVLSDLFQSKVGATARAALVDRATQLVGQATGAISVIQARVGLAQARVSDATDRLNAQSDLYDTHIQALEGVDPYEASTRVSNLLEQIQNSYALTARIQDLSLLKYLG